ncbi:hypothetical protein IEE91_01085 [Kocuria sp. cx-455]|uniref:hypothetical protein n=1 Tax=Kocuria sp. cx-455 TaxID=2771377 RepID=UPI00168715C3|nr:hypothetical protein [Kocuria sp. cx-455]MBD2763807.1 hypothetical protein [Kocuria sp. cx-455]
MSEELDPDLARALSEPARLVRADPALLEVVRNAGAPAQRQLLAQSSEASSTEDRYASAAMLAALFNDRGPLDQAARSYGSTPPRELVALSEVEALRPALKKSLSSPVLTGLLEWATKPNPADPPLELAMAARDLELQDASVLRSVASRAEQVAQQSTKRNQRGPLERVSEVLRQAADRVSETDGTTSTVAEPASKPSPQDPVKSTGGSDPAVTTSGIPESELVGDDEPDPFGTGSSHKDPRGTEYPGTGVPVRDSLNGPRPDAQDQPKRDKIFDADRFWPMGPRKTDDAAGDPPASQPPTQPAPPREPSTSELYYGVGSDRYADRDPDSQETRDSDKHVLRNWGIVFLVIIAIIFLLTLVL